MKPTKHIYLFFIFADLVYAGQTAFIREYTYQASDYDSRLTCQAIALTEVKRLLLEEIGTYLVSGTTVQNGMVVSDDISVYTAGAVQTKIIDQRWDGKTYWLKAQIEADPDSVAEAVKKIRENKAKTRELEALKASSEKALAEIAKLNKALEKASSDNSKFADQIKYLQNAQKLSAAQSAQQGLAALGSGDATTALTAFSRALEVDPNDAISLVNRGIAYARLNDHKKAAADYSRALKASPKDFRIYYNRGIAYYHSGEYAKALADFNRALLLKPNNGKAYFNRALTQEALKNNKAAISDYSLAIKQDPGDVQAYNNRGQIYLRQKLYTKALADFDKAIAIDQNYSEAYLSRAGLYAIKGDMEAALTDAQKAAELGNQDARVLLESLGR
jgi:tetratricopeptide (TPR) repeat protein